MARSFKRPDEAAMQRVFARTSGGAAEVVLRLAWLQGLSRKELNQLTWDQVDFANRVLLPERTVPMAEPVASASKSAGLCTMSSRSGSSSRSGGASP